MDTLTHLFSKLTAHLPTRLNFVPQQKTTFGKPPPQVRPFALQKHQRVIEHSLRHYLYPNEVNTIINGYIRTEVTPELIESDFFNGDIPDHPVPDDEYINAAYNDVAELFRPPMLIRPVHFLDVYHHYPFKRSTNAEPPFTTDPHYLQVRNTSLPARNTEHFRKEANITTGDLLDYDEFKEVLRQWIHIIKEGNEPSHRFFFHMTLHIKTAITKFDDTAKIRSIFGVPKLYIFAQIMFFWPLFNIYKRSRGEYPLLWGFETLNGGWLLLNHELFRSHMRSSFLMIDWKRFDKYARFSICRRLLTQVRTYFDFDNGYIPSVSYPHTHFDWTPAKAARIQRLWQWTIDALTHTPVVLPDGWLYTRLHSGIPSGLYITQYLDSIYNCLMILTILRRMGIPITDDFFLKVMGDDSLIRFFLLIPPNMHDMFWSTFQHWADHYFGAIVSIDKSSLTTNINRCEVLGYRNHNGLPKRDPISLLAQLYHTKARNPTPETTMSQAIGIAYASAGDKRVYFVCKNIYDYYHSLGISPNRKGLSLVFPELGLFDIYDIPIDRFPTRHESLGNILSFGYTNLKLQEKFWPSNYFLSLA
jgi:hypothetical protein